jgi:hypothetical protein
MIEPFTFSGFARRLFHRFRFGETSPGDYSHLYSIDNPRFRDLPFDSHFGPLSHSFQDAKTHHKTLFLYVYCLENPHCASAESLFRRPDISAQIGAHYLFCPLSITTADGYSVAIGVKFRALPLLLLVRPTGRGVQDSSIFLNHQGALSDATLLSSLGLERGHADPVAAAQDAEFARAVEADVIRRERDADVAAAAQERARTGADFANLPELAPSDHDVCTIRVHLPNDGQQMRVFPRSGPIAMLFAFANHFAAPRRVALYAGHPLRRIEDLEAPIGSICPAQQFVVYAIDDDE